MWSGSFGNLDSGFQSLVGFRIPSAGFRIPKPRIPDSTSKKFLDSGIRIPLHGANWIAYESFGLHAKGNFCVTMIGQYSLQSTISSAELMLKSCLDNSGGPSILFIVTVRIGLWEKRLCGWLVTDVLQEHILIPTVLAWLQFRSVM